MKYTLEEIYLQVGREDKVAGVTFRVGSVAYNQYGNFLTLLFLYTQREREEMDRHVQNNPFSMTGYLKAKYLGFDLPEDKVKKLLSEGIHSDDIVEISYFLKPPENTYNSRETRRIRKVNIQMKTQPKGGDLDWIYGFAKRQVSEGIGLCPEERNFYLAAKLFYEPGKLSDEERAEVYLESGDLQQSIEWELLRIKLWREVANDQEKKRLAELFQIRIDKSINLVDEYLKMAGSSLRLLTKRDPNQVATLIMRVLDYKERRLNVTGKVPIYVDVDSYMHIYTRHVEEVKLKGSYKDKDNFQWLEEDVFTVMEKVIDQMNDEIQTHFEQKPGQRFSKFGPQSVYFEGDYYTFHIECNGRVSTFHKSTIPKNKKSAQEIA